MGSQAEQRRAIETTAAGIASLPKSPLTGSEDVRFVNSIPAQQLINDWQTQFGIDITEEIKGVSQVISYRCNETGVLFFWPPSLEGSAQLYGQLQKKIDWYYSSGKWEHDFALQQLRSDDVVLEVGCGSGEFLERASQVVASVTGLEISETAVATAQARGLAAHRVSLRDWVAQHPRQATVCCAFQVLEHVANSKEFIELCIEAVKPQGRVIFGTPNERGYLRHQYDLLDLPPHHMSRWDIATYRSLTKIFPVRLKRYSVERVRDSTVDFWATSAARAVPAFLPKGLVLRAARGVARSPIKRFLTAHTICVVFERV